MYKNKTFLAIIPARGGSKRLPKKNSLLLNNKPLVAYSIEAGLKSAYIDKVVVSSDDKVILEVSQSFGSEIIKRPSHLATDTSSTYSAIEHVVENLDHFDYIVLLQPTSPLRNEEDIDKAIRLLDEKQADAVVSVCEVEHSPLWANTLDDSLSMVGFIKDAGLKRSQDLETHYRLNGAIYIINTTKLLENKRIILKENIFAFKMEREKSIDIDGYIDFNIAEMFLKMKRKTNAKPV